MLSRIRKEELAEPDKFKAGRLYQTILLNPGINLSALRTVSGLHNGTLIYHLDRLEKDGQIRSQHLGRLRLFYPSESAGEASELDEGLRYLSTNQKRILNLLTERPAMSQKAIVKATGMKQQLVSYHLRELEQNDLVHREGVRGLYTYTAATKASALLSNTEG